MPSKTRSTRVQGTQVAAFRCAHGGPLGRCADVVSFPDVVPAIDHRFDRYDLRQRRVVHHGAIKESPVSLESGMPKPSTAEYFFKRAEQCFRRSRDGDRKAAVQFDAMGNEFMAKALELDTEQQTLARGT